jgi:hypothetical protein
LEAAILDALYFPTLSLPSAAWTNPNLLYFDRIAVIAPIGDERDLFDGPTRLLIQNDLVRPIDPQRYAVDDGDDDAVLGHLLGLAMAQRRPNPSPTGRIHLGKMSYSGLSSELIKIGLLWRSRGSDWLEGPRWVIDYIMSVLAVRIMAHPELRLSLVTDQASALSWVAGVLQPQRSNKRLQALSRLLPIGPDALIDDILTFRQAHGHELKKFRGVIESLVIRSVEGSNQDWDLRRE